MFPLSSRSTYAMHNPSVSQNPSEQMCVEQLQLSCAVLLGLPGHVDTMHSRPIQSNTSNMMQFLVRKRGLARPFIVGCFSQ